MNENLIEQSIQNFIIEIKNLVAFIATGNSNELARSGSQILDAKQLNQYKYDEKHIFVEILWFYNYILQININTSNYTCSLSFIKKKI